jgi:hypothetical protein
VAEPEKQREGASYVLGMCHEICQSKSWKYWLSRGKSFYVNLQTIEMAFCLDALSEEICVAMLQREDELAKVLTLTMHMLFTGCHEFNHRCQLAELLDAAGLALEEPVY